TQWPSAPQTPTTMVSVPNGAMPHAKPRSVFASETVAPMHVPSSCWQQSGVGGTGAFSHLPGHVTLGGRSGGHDSPGGGGGPATHAPAPPLPPAKKHPLPKL